MPPMQSSDPMVEKVNAALAALGKAKAAAMLNATPKQLIAEVNGHRVHLVDMSLSALVYTTLDVGEGYSFTISKGGSDRFAVAVDLGDAGVFGPLYPGMTVRSEKPFKRVALRRWLSTTKPGAGVITAAGCTTVGSALTVAIGKTPGAVWIDPPTENAGFMWYRSAAAGAVAYGSTANVPTGGTVAQNANEGVNVRGAQSLRVALRAAAADTFLTGDVYWWYDDGTGQLWGETGVVQPIPTGRNIVWLPELEIKHKVGRYFPEPRNFTTSGGSGALAMMLMMAYGEGGELNAGDVVP